jgi:hypothetical protein
MLRAWASPAISAKSSSGIFSVIVFTLIGYYPVGKPAIPARTFDVPFTSWRHARIATRSVARRGLA